MGPTVAGAKQVYNFRSETVWRSVVAHRASNGTKRGNRCFRFDALMKKLALQIWITTGALPSECACTDACTGSSFYQFLHASLLEGALPCLSTVKSFCDVYVEAPITEYGLLYRRIAALPHWLQWIGYKLPLLAACNDATAILPRVRWRATDDAVFGAAVPDNELHRVDLRAGTSVNALLSQLAKYGLATQVEVFLVGPLDPRAPRFVVGVLAQTAGATAATTTQRWATIEDALQRFGLYVVCTGVDGGGLNVAAQHQYTTVRIIAVCVHLLIHLGALCRKSPSRREVP